MNASAQPRLRMFAGPNGSGKSTFNTLLPPALLGVYVNADLIEARARATGCIDLNEFGIHASADEVLRFFSQSSFLISAGLADAARNVQFSDNKLWFPAGTINSYFASVAGDLIRDKLLGASISLTFETVMSGADKIAFLRRARAAGFRVYLYYVATEDPAINISRVRHRVRAGGHSVPEDKIVSRYHRSLALLIDAVAVSDRAYLFDNSAQQRVFIAEVSGGTVIEMKTERMPNWFKTSLWDKFSDSEKS